MGRDKVLLLSHTIDADTPVYGTTPKPRIRTLRSLAAKDTCTMHAVSLTTHTGTHVDAPGHYIAGGKTVTE